ncbi:MAG: metallophosphoesterase family protein [Gemmatimonadaceae bacterium]
MSNSTRRFFVLVPLSYVWLGCPPAVKLTPPPAKAPAEEVADSGAAVLLAVGDIASCESQGDELTAALVDSILRADSAAKVADAVITLGDNAYPSGTMRDFQECFGPSWGDPKKLIMKRIRPSPGNHEKDRGSAYFQYFGDRAGPSGKGFYAFDLGAWRLISLNSEIVANRSYNGDLAGEQEEWLRAELKNNPKKCSLAYFHHPRWSSSYHGTDTHVLGLWEILYEAGVDMILVGHDHTYERFAPMTPAGVLDTLKGIPQIVVGTGGATLRGFRSPSHHSLARIEGHFGVLKMTLGADGYQHAFIDTRGRIWDPARGKCH